MLRLSYVLPLRSAGPMPDELCQYLQSLHAMVDLIVVDGSDLPVFEENARRLRAFVAHTAPDSDLHALLNGKVAGVLTGLRRCAHEFVIVADDDVRYDEGTLRAMYRELEGADVVRPQNYFEPLPWHACLDTARTLVNRISGGDWPGTLGVRRSLLQEAGGYDGNVLFENLELTRTIAAIGGRESIPLDLYVRRLPPDTRHFWTQRVRQAYDEFARPVRLIVWLALLPAVGAVWRRYGWRWAVAAPCGVIACLAEIGRRRSGGARVFPARASVAAPFWVFERAVSTWLAVGVRVCFGGVVYHGRVLARAATPSAVLRRRFNREKSCFRKEQARIFAAK